MENQQSNIDYNYEFSKSNRDREIVIFDKEFILNLIHTDKEGNKRFNCKEQKTFYKCNAFVIFNKEGKIIDINTTHNHKGNTKKVKINLTKNSIKENININDPFSNIPKKLYNNFISKPENEFVPFKSVQRAIYDKINKIIPKEVDSFMDIPEDHSYFYTLDKQAFLIKRTPEMLILMSKKQANILLENSENVFFDGTFYCSPEPFYQLCIMRVFNEDMDMFHTVSYILLKDKTEKSYYNTFLVINEYIENIFNKKLLIDYFHCDFEAAIANAAESVWKDITIKKCYYHYSQNLMRFIQKNFLEDFRDSEEAKIIHKKCQFLAFIPVEFVPKVFNLIKKDNIPTFFKKFINYFEKGYIKKNIDSWNYFNKLDHRTNNCVEGYNNMLNSNFNKKPSLFKLLFILREDEAKINKEFNYYNNKGYLNNHIKKFCKLAKSKDSVVNHYIKLTIDDIELLKKDNNFFDNKETHIWYEVVSKLVNVREDEFIA